MARRPSFRTLVERYVESRLTSQGFDYTPDRLPTFRRRHNDDELEVVQLIEFQRSVKRPGIFTVNLAVYSPQFASPHEDEVEEPHSWDCMHDMWTRPHKLISPEPKSWLRKAKELWSPSDPEGWWPYRGNESEIEDTFIRVGDLVLLQGQRWLQKCSSLKAFNEARLAREARREELIAWRAQTTKEDKHQRLDNQDLDDVP